MTLNAIAPYYPGIAFGGEPGRRGRDRIALGVALSLVLHALLLAAYRNKSVAVDAAGVVAPRSIAVWLRPPPAAALSEPEKEPAVQPTPSKPVAHTQRRRQRLIAVTPERAAPSQPFAVEPEPKPAPETGDHTAPRFDPDAARKMARELASAPDPTRAGTAVTQFPAKPYTTETKAARVISQARRRDCKDGIPGGLLAPLLLALDKKDSGCQW
jgi:outer membrane biosynthesis protein TonB